MKLIEGAIYKTKVGLFTRKYREESRLGAMLDKNCHVYYDQKVEQGYVFGCFAPLQGLYVIVPEQWLDENLELVDEVNLVPKINIRESI